MYPLHDGARSCDAHPMLLVRPLRSYAACATLLVIALRCYCALKKPRSPYACLIHASNASAVQESTGETPNMLMLGREVNTPTEMLVDKPPDWPDLNTDYARWLRDQLQVAWERARGLYNESAIRQKKNYDQRAQGGRFI